MAVRIRSDHLDNRSARSRVPVKHHIVVALRRGAEGMDRTRCAVSKRLGLYGNHGAASRSICLGALRSEAQAPEKVTQPIPIRGTVTRQQVPRFDQARRAFGVGRGQRRKFQFADILSTCYRANDRILRLTLCPVPVLGHSVHQGKRNA